MLQSTVDEYLQVGCGRCPLGGTPGCKVHSWTDELILLRKFLWDCNLDEIIKWGVPCYMVNGKNILLLSAFKHYAAISFFKGALLTNDHQLLEMPGKNSQAGRIMKFTHVNEILSLEEEIKNSINEAIEVEKAGLKVEFKKSPEPIPGELEAIFESDPIFKSAFESLTPGRQRGYILHFSSAKQSKTRISRIEKCMEKIFRGEGFNEYKRK